ncbi:MAG: hypothetical protein U1F33_16820 [Alphaproteobacteria bacterium]
MPRRAPTSFVARTTGGLEEVDDAVRAAGASATLVPLDIADYPALDRLGASLFERYGRVDVLVGAAASLARSPPSAISTRLSGSGDVDRRQRDGPLAAAAEPRSAPAGLRFGGAPIFVTDAGRARGARLLERLCREQVGARDDGEAWPTRWRARPSASIWSIRTPCARSFAPRPFPARIRWRCRLLNPVTDIFVALAEASSTRHGELIRGVRSHHDEALRR